MEFNGRYRRVPVTKGISSILSIIGNAPRLREGIKDCIITFDIETSRIDIPEGDRINHQSFMYIWQLHAQTSGEALTIYGRTWKTFLYLIEKLLNIDGEIIIYIHNASYEFQYISAFIPFKSQDVFCLKSRKILKARYQNITFKCSYLHSNMSLDQYAKTWKVLCKSHMEYEKLRFPWTQLTDEEVDYCCRDVEALAEVLREEMKFDGDTLETIPYTSTSYVRRDLKKYLYAQPYSLRVVKECYPDVTLYKMLRDAFRGGNTHANRIFAGQYINNTVIHSRDETSAYIYSLVCQKYPIKKFRQCSKIPPERLLLSGDYPYLFYIDIYDVALRNDYNSLPYISLSKNLLSFEDIGRCDIDNGRVLYAEHLRLCVTDIDYRILHNEYTWSVIKYSNVYTSEYGYLPEPFRQSCRDYFKVKSMKPKESFEYAKSKNKINAQYGMHAENPIRQNIIYNDGSYPLDDQYLKDPHSKTIEEYLSEGKKHAFLSYTWGVWTTAHARYNLWEGQNIVRDDLLYYDTDSVKYVGDYDNDFDILNQKRIDECIKCKGYATNRDGDIEYLGIFKKEPDMHEFMTLGAKKYAYRDEKGLHVTVSGVPKKKNPATGISYAAEELEGNGGVSSLKNIVFRAGKLATQWNDVNYGWYKVNDKKSIYISKNASLYPTEYTMNIDERYDDIIHYYNQLIKRGDITIDE